VTSTIPAALNDSGLVAASTGIVESEATGVIYRPGGDLLISDAFGFAGSEAAAINAQGAIVGAGIFDFAAQFPQPYLLRPGMDIEFLPKPLDDDVSEGRPVDINDEGIIVGAVDTMPGGAFEDRGLRAAVWQDGEVNVLGTLGGEFSVASRINNHGLVLGRSPAVLGEFAHSFTWTESAGMEQIPDPDGFFELVANDLNDAGAIVGWMDRDLFDRFAFVRDAATGEIVPLDRAAGEFVNQAHAINEDGVIVGTAQRMNEDVSFAKLWFDSEGYDLNSLVNLPEFNLAEAMDINERGQILVSGFTEVLPGVQQGFSIVLTPVPEPMSVALLSLGLLFPLCLRCPTRGRKSSTV
jgi:uncharacterized membrane protein